ncbi:MAG: DUF1552 domain-containing protein [Bryobacterales bacterium]|nr:DUF1552 domain-containing protein [Bryobacterales bacterium]
MTRKHLSRRTLLRGFGTAVALPFLDAMTPAFATKSEAARASALRLAFAYVPNGVTMQEWTPAVPGKAFEFTRILKPLEGHRERVTVLSGLAQMNAKALGDGPGDHARAAAAYLTGVHPRKTDGANIQNGVSIDQIVARHFEGKTRFGSLELGTEYGGTVGNCDSGYSCAYTNSLAWHNETTPLPPEINPRLVFERLFGASRNGETPAEARARQQFQRSVLDTVQEDTRNLMRDLGPTDRRKLDEYLYAVRDVEKRLERSANEAPLDIDMPKPAGIPAKFSDHLALMYDLIAIAFQADATRVATLMVGREGSRRTYREIGISDAHHPLSHHQKNQEKIEKITRINEYHMRLFAGFIDKLQRTPDGDASLLDKTVVVYGSCIGDGNRHNHDNLPILLAGGKRAGFRGGEHLAFADGTPMTNLYLTLLDRLGAPVESFGDSNGRLRELSGL